MNKKINVLLIGESWFIQTIETKGFDSFSVGGYGTGIEYIQRVLSSDTTTFTHMPSHLVDSQFPDNVEGLLKYDVIIISDVGANTFLLPSETFFNLKAKPNRLELLRDYVAEGGGLCMCGGYMSFMGIEGKGRYHGTVIEEILPVTFANCDDRVECPQGIYFSQKPERHPILNGMPETWPMVLGYNKAFAKPDAEVIVSYDGAPILALGTYKKGRTLAFATDIAPHWCSKEFCEDPCYEVLWKNIVYYLAGELG